jgi:hypothetical protein
LRRRLLLALALVLCLLLSACDGLAWLTDPKTTSVPAATATAAATATSKPTEHTPEPTPTETAAAPTATPASIPEASPSPTPDWTQMGEAGELTVRRDGEEQALTAYSREYVLRSEPHLGFCLLVPGELVQPEYDNNAWYFSIGEDGDSPAWLEMSFIAGTDAGELLPDFMNAYLSFTEIEFSGASGLGRVDMDETITASGNSLLVKAWLLNVPGGVFAVVLCCASDRLDADLPTLEAIAATLTLTM